MNNVSHVNSKQRLQKYSMSNRKSRQSKFLFKKGPGLGQSQQHNLSTSFKTRFSKDLKHEIGHSVKMEDHSEGSRRNGSHHDKRKDSIFSNLTSLKNKKRRKKKSKKKYPISKSNSHIMKGAKNRRQRMKSRLMADRYRKSLAPRMSMKNNFKPPVSNPSPVPPPSKPQSKNHFSNLYYHHSIQGSSLKITKSTLLELLSEKCIIEINLIQFLNPSIYCYDNFLNSLIFISKFQKTSLQKTYERKKSRFWIFLGYVWVLGVWVHGKFIDELHFLVKFIIQYIPKNIQEFH